MLYRILIIDRYSYSSTGTRTRTRTHVIIKYSDSDSYSHILQVLVNLVLAPALEPTDMASYHLNTLTINIDKWWLKPQLLGSSRTFSLKTHQIFHSLVPGRFGSNLKSVILEHMLQIHLMSTSATLFSGECRRIPTDRICQHCFRLWLAVIRQQAITLMLTKIYVPIFCH